MTETEARADRWRMMDEDVYHEDDHPFSGLIEEE